MNTCSQILAYSLKMGFSAAVGYCMGYVFFQTSPVIALFIAGIGGGIGRDIACAFISQYFPRIECCS